MVPKDRRGNLEYRDKIYSRCESDRNYSEIIQSVCRADPLWWMNIFGWTYRPKITCEDGRERSAGTVYEYGGRRLTVPPSDCPIITWPAQDKMVRSVVRTARNGGLLLVDKSRDQGATIIMTTLLVWCLLYWPRFSALVLSRKGDLVDGTGEESLMGKVDYQLGKLVPHRWMYEPSLLRRTMRPSYRSYRGSRLVGESSNQDVGQSLRTTLVFVDEASRFPYGDQIRKSLETVSACTVMVSTPSGPGTMFSQARLAADSPDGRETSEVVTLGYWDHPHKGRGRQWLIDKDGSVTGQIGSGYWETPAFRFARAAPGINARDWRENWLIDHETSGLLVLDSIAISRLRHSIVNPKRGTLDAFNAIGHWYHTEAARLDGIKIDKLGKRAKWLDDLDGNLYVWEKPSIQSNYVIGGDFGAGVEQSNTVLAVLDRISGKMVAEYVNPNIAPHEAAPIAMALGSWYGGQVGHAFIIWETNGPGMGFGHEIVKLRYPFLYYQRQEAKATATRTKKWGWHSSVSTRELLFEGLNAALRKSELKVYGQEGLDDMASWIYDDYGRIVCGSHRDESSGAQARHGDRAIAYALTVLGRREAPLFRKDRQKFPSGSYGQILGMDKVFAPPPSILSPFSMDKN